MEMMPVNSTLLSALSAGSMKRDIRLLSKLNF
jgi:hypothetical protein